MSKSKYVNLQLKYCTLLPTFVCLNTWSLFSRHFTVCITYQPPLVLTNFLHLRLHFPRLLCQRHWWQGLKAQMNFNKSSHTQGSFLRLLDKCCIKMFLISCTYSCLKAEVTSCRETMSPLQGVYGYNCLGESFQYAKDVNTHCEKNMQHFSVRRTLTPSFNLLAPELFF